jgi:RNA polymerase sigma-70 factor (ECF subfamily)
MNNDATGKLITDGYPVAFETIFKTHFKSLHVYAFAITKDEFVAEEMVQNVFFKLWEKRDQVQVNESVTAYLYKSVYNESLNYLKHNKVKTAYRSHIAATTPETDDVTNPAVIKELQHKIAITINELPEQCRTIFQLSRFEGLKYREIADKLGISVKTVENQLSKALKVLRFKLAEFLPVLIVLLVNIKNLLL